MLRATPIALAIDLPKDVLPAQFCVGISLEMDRNGELISLYSILFYPQEKSVKCMEMLNCKDCLACVCGKEMFYSAVAAFSRV